MLQNCESKVTVLKEEKLTSGLVVKSIKLPIKRYASLRSLHFKCPVPSADLGIILLSLEKKPLFQTCKIPPSAPAIFTSIFTAVLSRRQLSHHYYLSLSRPRRVKRLLHTSAADGRNRHINFLRQHHHQPTVLVRSAAIKEEE